jgi:hypothetical protein
MPTLRKNRGNIWLARVVLDGKQVVCRQFPPGKKGGPEWRAAKEWEEEQLKIALTRKEQETERLQTLSDLEKLLVWGEEYLAHAQRTMSRQTYVEKAFPKGRRTSFSRLLPTKKAAKSPTKPERT